MNTKFESLYREQHIRMATQWQAKADKARNAEKKAEFARLANVCREIARS